MALSTIEDLFSQYDELPILDATHVNCQLTIHTPLEWFNKSYTKLKHFKLIFNPFKKPKERKWVLTGNLHWLIYMAVQQPNFI